MEITKETKALAGRLLIGIMVLFIFIIFLMRTFSEKFNESYSPTLVIVLSLGLLAGGLVLMGQIGGGEDESKEVQDSKEA